MRTSDDDADWRDQVVHGAVDAAGRARLRAVAVAGDAAAGAALDEELALNRLLDARKAPPVSSNFTTRVLEGVREADAAMVGTRTGHAGAAGAWWRWLVRGPVWRWAGGMALLAWGAVIWLQQGLPTGRPAMSDSIAAIEVTRSAWISGLEPDTLANFDVVRRLNAVARPEDDELVLALMQ